MPRSSCCVFLLADGISVPVWHVGGWCCNLLGCAFVLSCATAPVELPFGGRKESGIGKENGLENGAIQFYSQVLPVCLLCFLDPTVVHLFEPFINNSMGA